MMRYYINEKHSYTKNDRYPNSCYRLDGNPTKKHLLFISIISFNRSHSNDKCHSALDFL